MIINQSNTTFTGSNSITVRGCANLTNVGATLTLSRSDLDPSSVQQRLVLITSLSNCINVTLNNLVVQLVDDCAHPVNVTRSEYVDFIYRLYLTLFSSSTLPGQANIGVAFSLDMSSCPSGFPWWAILIIILVLVGLAAVIIPIVLLRNPKLRKILFPFRNLRPRTPASSAASLPASNQ